MNCSASNSAVAVIAARASALVALLAPAIVIAAGMGGLSTAGKGFRAGKYYNQAATIASLGAADLKLATKAESIEGLLALARAEHRWNFDPVAGLQAWEKYNKISEGDQLFVGAD